MFKIFRLKSYFKSIVRWQLEVSFSQLLPHEEKELFDGHVITVTSHLDLPHNFSVEHVNQKNSKLSYFTLAPWIFFDCFYDVTYRDFFKNSKFYTKKIEIPNYKTMEEFWKSDLSSLSPEGFFISCYQFCYTQIMQISYLSYVAFSGLRHFTSNFTKIYPFLKILYMVCKNPSKFPKLPSFIKPGETLPKITLEFKATKLQKNCVLSGISVTMAEMLVKRFCELFVQDGVLLPITPNWTGDLWTEENQQELQIAENASALLNKHNLQRKELEDFLTSLSNSQSNTDNYSFNSVSVSVSSVPFPSSNSLVWSDNIILEFPTVPPFTKNGIGINWVEDALTSIIKVEANSEKICILQKQLENNKSLIREATNSGDFTRIGKLAAESDQISSELALLTSTQSPRFPFLDFEQNTSGNNMFLEKKYLEDQQNSWNLYVAQIHSNDIITTLDPTYFQNILEQLKKEKLHIQNAIKKIQDKIPGNSVHALLFNVKRLVSLPPVTNRLLLRSYLKYTKENQTGKKFGNCRSTWYMNFEDFNPFLGNQKDQFFMIYLHYSMLSVYIFRIQIILQKLQQHASDKDLNHIILSEVKYDRTWDPKMFPEWLVFEIENRIGIRPIQEQVAREMINNKDIVLQLDMGEGKSHVIVPLLCASIGNSGGIPRVNVLQPLFTQMMNISRKLKGALGINVYTFPYDRKIVLRPHNCIAIQQMLDECEKASGVIIATPEHRLSLELCYRDLLSSKLPSKTTLSSLISSGIQTTLLLPPPSQISASQLQSQYETLQSQSQSLTPSQSADMEIVNISDDEVEIIPSELSPNDLHGIVYRNYIEIFDEQDKELCVGVQHIYTSGIATPLDGGQERWKACQNILFALACANVANQNPELLFQLVNNTSPYHSIATLLNNNEFAIFQPSNIGIHAFPQIRFKNVTSPNGIANFQSLAELLWQCVNSFSSKFTSQKYNNITKFVLNKIASKEEYDTIETEVLLTEPSIQSLLLTYRGLLSFGVFMYALSRRHRVDYGLDLAREYKKMAVPFASKDTPTENTEVC